MQLTMETLHTKPFPLRALPPSAARYASQVATALNVSTDHIGAAILAVLAGSMGAVWRVKLKNSWLEPLTMWYALVGDSGSMKSPILAAATHPLHQLSGLSPADLTRYAPGVHDLTRSSSRLVIDNTTLEAVISRHAENPTGLIVVGDELASWLGSHDRYASGEGDLQNWIRLHGKDPIYYDRKTGDERNLVVETPSVSVIGGIQPLTLGRVMTPKFIETGFAARLLMDYMPSRRREFQFHDVDEQVQHGYMGLVRDLLYRRYTLPGMQLLAMTPFALEAYADFYNTCMEAAAELPAGALQAFALKGPMLTARLAGVIAIAWAAEKDEPAEEVNLSDVERACAVMEYFLPQYALALEASGIDFANQTPRKVALPSPEARYRVLDALPETFTAEDFLRMTRFIARTEMSDRTARSWRKKLEDEGLIEEVHGGGVYRQVTAEAREGLVPGLPMLPPSPPERGDANVTLIDPYEA